MATDEDRVRGYFIEQITESVPSAYLKDFQQRAFRAYQDQFQDAKLDLTTLPEQRLAKLIQDRVFRMDWELAETAKAQGLHFTSRPLPENGWTYTYVVSGNFGITQSYVPAHGALPKSAKFREGLAKAAGVPRLPLDEPEEIFRLKKFYALLAHTPISKRFDEEHQKLGSLQFCIPCEDMNAWAFEMSVAELLAHYPAAETATTTEPMRRPVPMWKPRPNDKAKSS